MIYKHVQRYFCMYVFLSSKRKHLYNIYTTSGQLLRRRSNIVQMLYKYFVLTGYVVNIAIHSLYSV